MKIFKSAVCLIVIVALSCLAMFGLHFYTAPLVEANRAGNALAPLLAVMPEGSSFDADALVYDAADVSSSALTDVPANVLKIYREANGNGYAVQCSTEGNYSTEPMELTFGVNTDGKICGLQMDTYTDSIDVRTKDENFLPSFVGQDSTLADVSLVTGCTFSSSSIRNAVLDAMETLTVNGLVSAGVKTPAQILTELIPVVAPGMGQDGVLKAEEIEASGSAEVAFQANNGAGFAYIMHDGESLYLAVVNAMGACAVYDVDGNVVTDTHSALAQEASTAAAAVQQEFASAAQAKLDRMFEDVESVTPLQLETFGTVVYAASFRQQDEEYTLFYCRSVGFDQMDIYVVLDANGAVAKVDAKQLFFETDYFPVDDTVDQPAYKAGFTGMTAENFPADAGMITGATMTSHAVRLAIADAFGAYAQIQNGGK